MLQWLRNHHREVLFFLVAVGLVILLILLFPPDIHFRVEAIKKMRPETYHPGSELIEARRLSSFDELSDPDKSDSDNAQKIKHLLDDLQNKFNVDRYFEKLNHLSMEDGYILDYSYYMDTGRGFPMLYARPVKSRKLIDQNDFEENYGEATSNSKTGINAYFDHIRSDGTRESFIQLAVLRLIGDQFYLYWHGNYKDTDILSRVPAWVNFSDSEVAVSIFVFTKWGGVKLHTMKIRRNFPHSFISEKSIVIIPYNCGIRF